MQMSYSVDVTSVHFETKIDRRNIIIIIYMQTDGKRESRVVCSMQRKQKADRHQNPAKLVINLENSGSNERPN